MPDYGRDATTGAVVHIKDARRGRAYVCPVCRHPLELRRGVELEYFAHWRGLEGTRECELFAPDDGPRPSTLPITQKAVVVRPEARVEDAPSEAGLVVDLLDGQWQLAIRLPEIPASELEELSLAALRPAAVEIGTGDETLSRLSALELLPGVGAGRAVVPPSMHSYRARPTGTWPGSIHRLRWQLEARGLLEKGTLFRLRRGEWTRLVPGSGVHTGESLLVLANTSSSPPPPIIVLAHVEAVCGGVTWKLWEVRLLHVEQATVGEWVSRTGHTVVPRRWSVVPALPPRAYTETRDPVYWAGDVAVLSLEAPSAQDRELATASVGSNAFSEIVNAGMDGTAFVALTSRAATSARLQISGGRSAGLEVEFVSRPATIAVLELLKQTPRLRLWVGATYIEAWRDSLTRLSVEPRSLPDVRIDLGSDNARVTLSVTEQGRRRTLRSLSAREASKAVQDFLPTSSLLELDGENLGRIAIAPVVASNARVSNTAARSRLDGYERLLRVLAEHHGPRSAIGATALVRARMAQRRRSQGRAPR